MIPSKREAVCPVCHHKQPFNWEIPHGDPPKCNKCGHYMHPKMYNGGLYPRW
jgi:NAD-dependent SIR2 family protein deacetylase